MAKRHHQRHEHDLDRTTDLGSAAVGRRPFDIDAHVSARYCPECGMPAWVEWRDGSGANEHVKVRCFAGHWFLMLAERLG